MAMTTPLTAPRVGEPAVQHVSTTRFLTFLLPMAMTMYGAFQGGQFVLLPIQLQNIDPKGKVLDLAVVVVACAVSGALGVSGGGWVTDFTRTRWGGRPPWLLGMGLVSTALFAAIGFQTDVLMIGALATIFWLTLNFFQGALLTALSARTPPNDRTFVAAMFAVAGPIGGLYGYNLAALTGGALGYVALAASFLAFLALYLIFAPEAASGPRRARPEAALAGRPDTIFASFRRRDFLLAFIFRIALFSGQATIMNYVVYFMVDRIGLDAIPAHSAEIANGQIASVRTVFTLVGLALGMALARRTARMKIFLQGYALLMAAAALGPVFSADWNMLLFYGALGGFAWGFYATVDIALMNVVLPNPATRGRDLGMLAMTGALGQLVGPPLASGLIHSLGYSSMFEAGAILSLCAGLAAGFMKGVR